MFAPLETGLKNVFQNLSTEFRLKSKLNIFLVFVLLTFAFKSKTKKVRK